MPNLSFVSCKPSYSVKTEVCIYDPTPRIPFQMLSCVTADNRTGPLLTKTSFPGMPKGLKLKRKVSQYLIQCIESNSISSEIEEDSCTPDEDDGNCPVDCVREFKTDEEFSKILAKAKRNHSLVVVDFYRTSCGSCKYIEQGFVKLCKGSGDHDNSVIFLKHNKVIQMGQILVWRQESKE